MSSYVVPAVIALVLLHGVFRGVNIFDALAHGIMDGIRVCVGIFPPVLIMLCAIAMLRASGAIDMVAHALTPLLGPLGIPSECIPLALLRPFSGSGALSVGSEIISANGPQSAAGMVAAVMLG